MSNGAFTRACLIGTALWLAAAGCRSAAQNRAQLQSPNPVDRARAAVVAAERKDRDAVHALIGLLDDPEIAVRLYAIEALRRLTGNDYGYRYYASDADRAAAIARWQAAARSGELTLGGTTDRARANPDSPSPDSRPAS